MKIPEKDLWIAVLAQAVNDAIQENPYSPEDRRAKDAAIKWFKKAGRDFEQVCTFAGFDPVAVKEAWDSGQFTRISVKRPHVFAEAAE